MRTIACLLGALALAAVVAGPAPAQTEPKSQGRHIKKSAPQYPGNGQGDTRTREPDGYREQLADKLRMGSSAWWDQMKREGRLGGETP